ncbi:hypothetical protein [Streptomyces sp. MA15]|nr:hypothetical protein [Streptomyces sp. MA15]MDN3272482.1 hypothetical protein [Streptomyces sp. MA15]
MAYDVTRDITADSPVRPGMHGSGGAAYSGHRTQKPVQRLPDVWYAKL